MNYKNRSRKKPALALISLFFLFTLISCNNGKKEPSQAQQLPVLPAKLEQTGTPITEQPQFGENKTGEKPSLNQNNTEVMLNPPHGEPFHRCDIPVGAPLTSANTNKEVASSQLQTFETKTDEKPSVVQNNAEVMLNPPHGQPFHRCDIPVGSPLPPADKNNQTATSQVQTTAPQLSTTPPNSANNPFAPTVENAKRLNSSQARSTTTATNGTKPRLNPPHGQPFHRCDIPVGGILPNTP